MGQRYQKEIEEILERVNDKRAPSSSPRAPQQVQRPSEPAPRRMPSRPQRPARSLPTITPGRLMLAGVLLILGALAFNSVGLGQYAGVMTWVGIGLLIFAYIRYFTTPRRETELRWRGQSIEDPKPKGPLMRFWRWLNRK